MAKATMKNANGMGCVYKLSGNRRKPWAACVTESISKMEGKYQQKRKIIGYYESYELAEFSLWSYNKNPILFDKMREMGTLTFENLYQEWSNTKFRSLSYNAINGYKAAFQKCASIKDMAMCDIKTFHYQKILNESTLSVASDLKLKSLFVVLSDYAMQNDIINKNYAKYVEINYKKTKANIHRPFSEEEIEKLIENDRLPFVDTIIIMIYTGFRIGELLAIKTKDVDIKTMCIKGGSKSDAGKDRIVPCHMKIRSYIMKHYVENSEYLIHDENLKRIDYHSYRKEFFDPIMKHLKMNHLPHDCRHTFATRLSNVGANTTAIKKLIGHANYETTERIYTHKDMMQLRTAIEKLK